MSTLVSLLGDAEEGEYAAFIVQVVVLLGMFIAASLLMIGLSEVSISNWIEKEWDHIWTKMAIWNEIQGRQFKDQMLYLRLRGMVCMRIYFTCSNLQNCLKFMFTRIKWLLQKEWGTTGHLHY